MNFFLQYKIIILRSFGTLMLVLGFGIYFWTMPPEGLSENDKAIARVARMEESAKGSTQKTKKSNKKDDSKFMNTLKDTQAKQLQYMTIIAMVFGVGFLGYSFLPRKEDI